MVQVNAKTVFFLVFLQSVFFVSKINAQFRSTGLTVTVSSGTILSINDFESDGRLVNNGRISARGDIIIRDYSGSGSFVLDGGSQALDLSESVTISNLTINGGGVKQFGNSITVTNDLTLINGVIQLEEGHVTMNPGGRIGGGSNASYIVGKLTQTGNGVMTFPIGSTTLYTPVTFSNMQANLVRLSLEHFEENPSGIAGRGAIEVTNNRYWELTDESNNFEGAQVSLPMINETIAATVENVVVLAASPNSETFNSYGRNFTTGSLTTGTIFSAQKVPAGRLALGRFFDENLRVADSLALVSLYNDTRGRFWINNSGWQKSKLDDWFGIVLDNKRVTQISLPTNNLEGSITSDAILPISELTLLNVASNKISSIPSFNNASKLAEIDVSDNMLNFSHLQSQNKLTQINYVPQATLLRDTTLVVDLGRAIALDRKIPGNGNVYAWVKDGNVLSGGTRGDLFVQNAATSNEGKYKATVTNPAVPNLTLEVREIELFVSSLARDIAALLEMYQNNNGENWQNPNGQPINGWRSDVDISQWSLVKLNSSGFRVEEVNLNNVGVRGDLPGAIGAMTFVKSFDFANNDITSIPSLRKILNLGKLDVSNNRLDYESIQNNLGTSNFKFSPQKPLSARVNVKVPAGKPHEINLPVRGRDLSFVWRYNGKVIPNETTSRLGFDSVTYDVMGIYQLEVRDKLVAAVDPNFSLKSGEQNLQATASLSGTVFNIDEEAVNNSRVTLWAIRPSGIPYDSIGTISTVGNEYTFNDVVLDDYIVVASTNLDRYIPTYHESSITWSVADRIVHRKATNGIRVVMLDEPNELIAGPDNDNEVNGFIELDTDDFPEGTFTGGRTLGRRRVANVGISFNRLRSSIRGEDVFELIAYVISDENGSFKTENLPRGTYRINVEYPGIPMDPTSFVEFELGEDQSLEKNIVSVLAEIKPKGIQVGIFKETGIKRQWLTDLNVFPNPAVDRVTISYQQPRPQSMIMQVVDINGKLHMELDLVSGSQQFDLDVSTMMNGLYVIRFIDKELGISNVEGYRLLIQR